MSGRRFVCWQRTTTSGAGYRHSAPVAGTQRHCAHSSSNGCPGDGHFKQMQTGQVDLMIGWLTPRSGRLHRPPAAVLLPVPASLLWQARRRGRPQALRGSARPRDRLCQPPFRWRHPARQATGSPPKTSCSAWWSNTCPDDRDRLPQVDYALSQRNDTGLVKAPFQPPTREWCFTSG